MFTPLAIMGTEWIIVIVIVVVLLFGASKLPDLAKSVGRASGEFQKGRIEAEKEIQNLKAQNPPSEKPVAQPSEHDKLLKAAWELGISTEGKTDDQIRAEIQKAIA